MSNEIIVLQVNTDFSIDDSCGFVSTNSYKYYPSYEEVTNVILEINGHCPTKIELGVHYRFRSLPYFEEYK